MRAIEPLVLTVFKWLLTIGIVGAVLAAAYLVNEWGKEKERATEAAQASQQQPKFKAGTIKLNKVLVGSYGIKEEAAKDIEWVPKTPVYGRVVANPRATTEVRAAFA
jgi:hypothetical protein